MEVVAFVSGLLRHYLVQAETIRARSGATVLVPERRELFHSRRERVVRAAGA